jgi:hypothetical protein
VAVGSDFDNLIDTLVLRKIEPILLCDSRCDEPGRNVRRMEQVIPEDGKVGLEGERMGDMGERNSENMARTVPR